MFETNQASSSQAFATSTAGMGQASTSQEFVTSAGGMG